MRYNINNFFPFVKCFTLCYTSTFVTTHSIIKLVINFKIFHYITSINIALFSY